MIIGTNYWIHAFGLAFIVMSVMVLVNGWYGERRRKRRWERKCERARQMMIEREKREGRYEVIGGRN